MNSPLNIFSFLNLYFSLNISWYNNTNFFGIAQPNTYLVESIEEQTVSHQEKDTTKPNIETIARPSLVRKPPSWLKNYIVRGGECHRFLSRICYWFSSFFGLPIYIFCNHHLLEVVCSEAYRNCTVFNIYICVKILNYLSSQ